MIIEGEDSITHINIFSTGKTILGRLLSNFSYSPFKCEDGEFYSIEGYWYWLQTKDKRLRFLHGYQAKKLGSSLPKIYEELEFEKKIKKAIICKIKHNKYLIQLLRESYLPFCHYYVFSKEFRKDAGHDWLIEFISLIRDKIQENS